MVAITGTDVEVLFEEGSRASNTATEGMRNLRAASSGDNSVGDTVEGELAVEAGSIIT